MILIELNQKEKDKLELLLSSNSIEYEVIQSKKLGGGEIIFQIIITAVSIASPYVIDFFKSKDGKFDRITIVKDGIRMSFENEEDLKEYLDSIFDENND